MKPSFCVFFVCFISISYFSSAQQRQQACGSATFQKTYGGTGTDIAYDMIATADGGFLLSGSTNSFGAGGTDGFLLKTDNSGNLEWMHTYGGGQDDLFTRLMANADGTYIVVGQTKSFGIPTGGAWIQKVDGTGTVLWSRQYGENNPYGEIVNSLCATSDGGYAFVGRNNNRANVSSLMVIKTDANGVRQWDQVYDTDDTDQGAAILEDNGGLIIWGHYRDELAYHNGILMRIDINNGTKIWLKEYDLGIRNNFSGGRLVKVGNTYQMYSPTIDDLSNLSTGRQILLTTDLNGIPVNVLEVQLPDYTHTSSGMFVPTGDGGFITQLNDYKTTSDFNLVKVNQSGQVEWSRAYAQAGQQINLALRPTNDGGWASAGYSIVGGNTDIYFVKTDGMGNTACTNTTVAGTVITPSYTVKDLSWSWVRAASFVSPIALTPIVNTPILPQTTLCTQPALSVDLGPDLQVCEVTSYTLHAGDQFDSYLWQDNSADSLLTVHAPGQYHVAALDACGQVFKDTIIVSLYPRPALQLGSDTSLCAGEELILDAGGSMLQYEWQDQSTDQYYTASQPGSYWVKVTDANHCETADTMEVVKLYGLPGDFLPAKAEKCPDEDLVLAPDRSYSSYHWNTSASSSSITIPASGEYWLLVTDAYGCQGSDTVTVTDMICKKQLQFPNAFAPGGNYNKVFRPVVSGTLAQFTLTIYNRWGQRVFETRDCRNGWNGAINGNRQDTNMFVWVCRYRFTGNGQQDKMEKGTVTLVR